MKKSLLILLFCGSLLFVGQAALAQNSKIAVGGMINGPTGLSMKAWINEDIAVDAAFTFSLQENFSDVYLHSDILQHGTVENYELLKYYYGLGVRLNWLDGTDDLVAGLRGPIGTEYSFEETNITSFLEVAPTLDFSPDARFFFAGAVGMRIYLN